MTHKNLCEAIVTPLSPVGLKGISYNRFITWLVLRGSLGASGGVPTVRGVANI